MKNRTLLLSIFTLVLIFSANTQTYMQKATSIKADWYRSPWTIGGHGGVRALGLVGDGVENGLGLAFNGGIGYSFTDAFSAKGRFDFYNHKLTPGFGTLEETKANSAALSLTLNMNLVTLLNKARRSDWVLDLYAGSGLTTSWNPDRKELGNNNGGFEDPGLKGNDDMGHIIFGLNPQYYVTSRFALSLDVSYFHLIAQSNTYDYRERVEDGQAGNALTIGLGFIWRPYGTKK